MACSAATIRSHAVLLICLSLPGTSLSKAAGSFQDPEDLLKVIVSVPVGDRQKALALLDEHKDLVNQAFCRLLLSEAEKAYNTRDAGRSLFLLEILEAASARTDNVVFRATAYLRMGKVYSETRQPQKALAAYENSIRLTSEPALQDQRPNVKRVLAMALYGLARVRFETSAFQSAIESYKRSLKVFEELDSKLDCIYILNDLGALYLATGDYKTASDFSHRSLSLTEALSPGKELQIPIRYSKAVAWSNLGYISFSQGSYGSAIDYLEKSLALFRELVAAGQPYLTAVADRLEDLGQVFRALGNYSKALHYYQRALMTVEGPDHPDTRQRVLNSVGILYTDQGDYAKAGEFLETSLKLATQLENKTAVATVLINVGLTDADLTSTAASTLNAGIVGSTKGKLAAGWSTKLASYTSMVPLAKSAA